MIKKSKLIYVLFISLSFPVLAEKMVISVKVNSVPQIDGFANEKVWGKALEVTTRDTVANIDIKLKSVYTKDKIYFLVRFPDSTKNISHKRLVWNKKNKLYRIDTTREDNFVFKWSMEPYPVSLKLGSNNNYTADIWYWKSFRTDHAGYADDKYQIYSDTHTPKSHTIFSQTGKDFYLQRKGDKGISAYGNKIPIKYQGDIVVGFTLREPTGSRADVRAKGRWDKGVWTVEFSRALNTHHDDDVSFEPGLTYNFGVSRYEIAGRSPNPKIEVPLFGSGEISEPLLLKFQ